MVRLTAPFSRLRKCKVLVAGDLLLDTYTIGKARRISPEAPVPVLLTQNVEHRPGGAGNVILNLISMGAEVIALGRVGSDAQGEQLIQALAEENVSTQGIVYQKGYPTPVKNRIIADNQQMVRVDYEVNLPLEESLEQKLIQALPGLLEGVEVISLSDYGKGFLTPALLKSLIEIGRSKEIPIIADPKGIDFAKYAGATVLKPNLSEAYASANLPSEAPLDQVAHRVIHLAQCETLMITRSEAGISLFFKEGLREDFPVKPREVKDVTGAGDTVLALLTCALASGLNISEAAQLSNVAAGIAIERLGCARVSLSDLARRLLNMDVGNKIFDEEHLFALEQALHNRKFALLGLSGKQGMSNAVFSSIKTLSHRPGWDLLIYIADSEADAEFIHLLASLNDIDFILMEGENLRNLYNKIHPNEVYEIRDNKLIALGHASELVPA